MRNFSKKGGSKILAVIYIFFICILAGLLIVSCRKDDGPNNIVTINDHFKDDPDKIGSKNSNSEELPDEEVDADIVDNDSDALIEEEAEEDGSDEESVEEENSEQNGDEEIDYGSSDNFRIEVDLSVQKVFVYYKDNLIREMICSGGTAEKPTPTGEFTTTQKGPEFFNPKYNQGAYYWIRFDYDYLFHSVPFDENHEFIQEEIDKLGTPASHGCIRLKLDEVKWMYDMLPMGVKVKIY